MRKTLQKYFGYSEFYPLQEDIISDVLSGGDVLVLMPTGGGKSLCYQIPAVIKDGITVVISPLISLMKDQVDDLISTGIQAATINSTLDYESVSRIKAQLVNQQIKLLYLAPERIMMPGFFSFLQRLNLNLFAVDEAHCISEWGHDFRPEYRNLNLLKKKFPAIPLIALTSTAIPQVQDDIVNQLNMISPKIYKGSLDRKNLFYEIRPKKKVYQHLARYIRGHSNDSGIIYCQSRKSVDSLAAKLQNEGIRALPYHAGLSAEERAENQERFVKDDVGIITATIAFGMGIDKPNVRYVIHCDMPKSIESYYQETGRAGRDGLRSDCILFFSYADKIKQEYFIKQIEDEQYKQIAYKKMWQMINFSTSKKCRRKYLLNYFGEKHNIDNCSMCDICKPVEQIQPKAVRVPVEIVLPAKGNVEGPKAQKYSDVSESSGFDRKLFEVLRTLRKDFADKEKMPPYIVFPDAALREMAVKYPRDLKNFGNINGVGEIKLRKYGNIFLDKIITYCRANNIKPDVTTDNIKIKSYSVTEIREKHTAAYEKWTTEQERILVSEYDKGKTVKELSKLLGRQPGGIRSRLKKLAG